MIAALYIDPKGPYPALCTREADGFHEVDCWPESRDARLYAGPWPVVAHPPCGPWGSLRHEYTGSEHDCAIRAVEQVRRWGGVLEHPAGSKLWEVCGLPRPASLPGLESSTMPKRWPGFVDEDAFGGYSIELAQVEWGHVARKRTWLYLVSVPREALEEPPYPGRKPTHWVSGWARPQSERKRRTSSGVVPPGIKVCSAQQRRRTPLEFAAYLVRLARAAGEARRAA